MFESDVRRSFRIVAVVKKKGYHQRRQSIVGILVDVRSEVEQSVDDIRVNLISGEMKSCETTRITNIDVNFSIEQNLTEIFFVAIESASQQRDGRFLYGTWLRKR